MLVVHHNPLHQCHVLIKNARPRSKGSKFSVRGSQVPLPSNRNELERILKARQRALERELRHCSPAQLEHLLTSVKAKEEPCRLNKHLSNVRYKGFTALIVEVMPLLPSEPPATLVRRCVDYVSWGADAISVRTDLEASSTGLQTLSMVSQEVNVPLICSDWIIHPIQIAQAVEAGASSVRLVYAVIKKGLKPHLRYADSLGLDAIVEVVNLNELEDVSKMGVSVYGMNLSVGLSLPIPGLRQDISKSLIEQMPFGTFSITGVSSVEEAQEMRLASADAVYIKQEMIENFKDGGGTPEQFLERMKYCLSGDD